MKKQLTLCIIHKSDKVLLGMKKRGFGVGNWNGFGGKVMAGETIKKAATRELFEESGIKPTAMEKLGVLDFSWEGKPEILQVTVFKVKNFSGVPRETEEMKPRWFLVNEIPYQKMWPDDAYWFPLFLKNKKFQGKFIFNSRNQIIKHELS